MATTKTTVGDRVKLKDGLLGVVRFMGEIKGKKGVFYGVELDDAKGKNDGSVNKVAYFKCKAKKGVFTTKAKIAKTNSKPNAKAPRVEVGDVVKCTKAGCKGTIKFIGTPYSVKSSGVFYGVALEKAKGKNNGTVKGRWYFDAKDKHGTFLQADGFTLDGKAKAAAKKTSAAKKKTEKKDDEKKEDVEFVVGDKVEIKPNRKGQIRWIGEDKEFGAGDKYYGIRLTEKRGDCDGEWKERRKFYCPEGFGQFVKITLIKKKIEGDFDFMNEDEKYEEELRQKAEVYKKEQEKLQRLRDKFNEIDTDGNQMVDRAEFNRLASLIFECTTAETNALFREIDVNDSQTISFAEFDAWVDKLGGIEQLDKLTGDDEANKEEDAGNDDNKEEAADDGGDKDNAENADAAEDAGADNEENADKAEEAAAGQDAEEADEKDENAENEEQAAGDEAAGGDEENAGGNEENAEAAADAGGDDENAGGDEAAGDEAAGDEAAGDDAENAKGDEENAAGDEARGDEAGGVDAE